jgi:hypothetical protein
MSVFIHPLLHTPSLFFLLSSFEHFQFQSLSIFLFFLYPVPFQGPIVWRLGLRSETSGELTVRSNLVGNAGSRPISEAKQPWACPVLGWGTTGEAHVLYSLIILFRIFF